MLIEFGFTHSRKWMKICVIEKVHVCIWSIIIYIKVYKNCKREYIILIWAKKEYFLIIRNWTCDVRNLVENEFMMPILRFQNKDWYNWAKEEYKNFIRIIILCLIHDIAIYIIDEKVVGLISCPHM